MRKKKLIISLIKDDLICNKLIEGLNALGLNASDYYLNLSDTIFKLMKFSNSKGEEKIYEQYLKMTKRVKHIDIADTRTHLDNLAHEIYTELRILKSKLK